MNKPYSREGKPNGRGGYHNGVEECSYVPGNYNKAGSQSYCFCERMKECLRVGQQWTQRYLPIRSVQRNGPLAL